MKMMPVDLFEEYDRPIGLCPVIPVDTNHEVNVQDVVQRIREHWPDLAEFPRLLRRNDNLT